MGYLTFYGDDNVEVPEGFLAETTAGMQYVTLSSGVITKSVSFSSPATAMTASTLPKTSAMMASIFTPPAKSTDL